MLLAEIHGQVLEAAVGNEDYLTSAVFGHLRYVAPQVFWQEFLSHAKSIPVDGHETSVIAWLADRRIQISDYSSLEFHFWPSHPAFGQPDLILCFTGKALKPLIVLLEAKLWSEKSGTGEQDQLIRYLGILDDLQNLTVRLPESPEQVLVYLTPRESINEILDSLAQSRDPARDRERIFRLQWQDLVVSAGRASSSARGMERTILCDVMRFLQRRKLEYFKGYSEELYLPLLEPRKASFYRAGSMLQAFSEIRELDVISVRRGDWVR